MKFIADRFSPKAVEAELLRFIDDLATRPVRRLSSGEKFRRLVPTPLRFFLRGLRRAAIFSRN
jgi:hypothetical protein